MSISFDFSSLVKDKQKIKPALQNRVNGLIYKHSTELYERYLRKLPYCTGNLINSADIDFRLSSRGWVIANISNDAEYAIWIENGDTESDGNFSLALAISETTQNLKRDLLRPRKAGQLLKTKEARPPRAEALGKLKSGQCKNPP